MTPNEMQIRSAPEESLEVFWQLSPAGIARVHGDKDAHRRDQVHILAHEVKPLLLVSNGILNTFDLIDINVNGTGYMLLASMRK